MSYLLIRQIEKLPKLGFSKKEEILTCADNFGRYSDEQLDLVDQITETFRKLFKATGLLPSECEKNLLAKHDIHVNQEPKGTARTCLMLSTPFGKLEI